MEDLQEKLWKAIESKNFNLVVRLVRLGADLNEHLFVRVLHNVLLYTKYF